MKTKKSLLLLPLLALTSLAHAGGNWNFEGGGTNAAVNLVLDAAQVSVSADGLCDQKYLVGIIQATIAKQSDLVVEVRKQAAEVLKAAGPRLCLNAALAEVEASAKR